MAHMEPEVRDVYYSSLKGAYIMGFHVTLQEGKPCIYPNNPYITPIYYSSSIFFSIIPITPIYPLYNPKNLGNP